MINFFKDSASPFLLSSPSPIPSLPHQSTPFSIVLFTDNQGLDPETLQLREKCISIWRDVPDTYDVFDDDELAAYKDIVRKKLEQVDFTASSTFSSPLISVFSYLPHTKVESLQDERRAAFQHKTQPNLKSWPTNLPLRVEEGASRFTPYRKLTYAEKVHFLFRFFFSLLFSSSSSSSPNLFLSSVKPSNFSRDFPLLAATVSHTFLIVSFHHCLLIPLPPGQTSR